MIWPGRGLTLRHQVEMNAGGVARWFAGVFKAGNEKMTLCEAFFDQYNPPNASKMKEHILNNKVARFYVYTTKPHCLI